MNPPHGSCRWRPNAPESAPKTSDPAPQLWLFALRPSLSAPSGPNQPFFGKSDFSALGARPRRGPCQGPQAGTWQVPLPAPPAAPSRLSIKRVKNSPARRVPSLIFCGFSRLIATKIRLWPLPRKQQLPNGCFKNSLCRDDSPKLALSVRFASISASIISTRTRIVIGRLTGLFSTSFSDLRPRTQYGAVVVSFGVNAAQLTLLIQEWFVKDLTECCASTA